MDRLPHDPGSHPQPDTEVAEAIDLDLFALDHPGGDETTPADDDEHGRFDAPHATAGAPRTRRLGFVAAGVLAALATGALALSGGAGDDSISQDLAASGVQSPDGSGHDGGKSLGHTKGNKVLSERGGKQAAGDTTTTGVDAGGSTTSAGATATTAGATGATATTAGPSAATATPGSAASGTAAPRPATPGTAPGAGPTVTTAAVPRPTAPPTTAAPPAPPPPPPPPPPAPRPSGGGTNWSPSGPTYWVAADGNDGADGSAGAPWRTFAHALRRLQPGDTLLVRGGTYGSYSTTQILNIEGVHGRAGAPITVAAAPGEGVSLLGGGWEVVRVGNSSYVDVRNFDISGDAQHARTTANGIAVSSSHHIRIIGNTVHDLGGGGIGTAHSNHVTIDGNRVFNTSMWNQNQSSAISLWESSNIGGGNNADGFSFYIRNNVAYNNRNNVGGVTDGNCIIVDSNRNTGYTGSTFVANNVCQGNGGRGVHVFIADNVVAYNNTLVGNLRSPELADGGELSANTASNVHFRNNLVIPAGDRPRQGATVWQTSNITFAHNVYAGADHGLLGPGDRLVGDAVVNGEFVPQPGSPAIDAGTADGAPTTDRRGRARNGAPDAGAYEG